MRSRALPSDARVLVYDALMQQAYETESEYDAGAGAVAFSFEGSAIYDIASAGDAPQAQAEELVPIEEQAAEPSSLEEMALPDDEPQGRAPAADVETTEDQANEDYQYHAEVSTCRELQSAIQKAPAGKKSLIDICKDFQYDGITVDQKIKSGQDITVDLQGYTVDHYPFTLDPYNGSVFTVDGGKLTLTNSSEQTAMITGGKIDFGGGIYVRNGSLVVEKGKGVISITDNTGKKGAGGVYAVNSTVTLNECELVNKAGRLHRQRQRGRNR